MWILVKVDDVYDVGKNEQERIVVIEPDTIEFQKALGSVQFQGRGFEAHPMTPVSEDWHSL